MSNEIALPQGGMADAFKNYAAQQGGVESLSEGITGSYGVLGYKGKTWSLRYKGEQHFFKRPDDGTAAASIEVIILRQAKQKSKSYYDSYDEHQSQGARPICASLDGILPDDDVAQKQSETCALCPRNHWHTNDKGKKVKDCSDYKRLAVLIVPAQSIPFFGEPLMEPVFLRVPAASLEALGNYGDDLARQGVAYYAVVTRVAFEPDTAYPKFTFRHVQVLGKDDAPVILPMLNDDLSLRVTGEDKVNRPQLTHTLSKAIAGPAQPVSTPAQQTVIPPKQAPKPQPSPTPSVSGGLFGAAKNLDAGHATSPLQTVTEARIQEQMSDVVGSDPTESTPEIDAAIANLLQTT